MVISAVGELPQVTIADIVRAVVDTYLRISASEPEFTYCRGAVCRKEWSSRALLASNVSQGGSFVRFAHGRNPPGNKHPAT